MYNQLLATLQLGEEYLYDIEAKQCRETMFKKIC